MQYNSKINADKFFDDGKVRNVPKRIQFDQIARTKVDHGNFQVIHSVKRRQGLWDADIEGIG